MQLLLFFKRVVHAVASGGFGGGRCGVVDLSVGVLLDRLDSECLVDDLAEGLVAEHAVVTRITSHQSQPISLGDVDPEVCAEDGSGLCLGAVPLAQLVVVLEVIPQTKTIHHNQRLKFFLRRELLLVPHAFVLPHVQQRQSGRRVLGDERLGVGDGVVDGHVVNVALVVDEPVGQQLNLTGGEGKGKRPLEPVLSHKARTKLVEVLIIVLEHHPSRLLHESHSVDERVRLPLLRVLLKLLGLKSGRQRAPRRAHLHQRRLLDARQPKHLLDLVQKVAIPHVARLGVQVRPGQ
mmetsp:Transcript_39020/g.97676  ORF Transcript_39020/g.97676 Transcript_39020/m.97676 type:complete len:292 (+) Transcript_39020:1748-2623(+)